ncbi:MAG: lysophospholipid acyltransferase family protein, partial [Gemmatimonadota bacterium]
GLTVVERALAALPEEVAVRLGAGIGGVAYRPLRIRRGTVERQLRAAFPGRPERWVRAVARACYRHFGREAVATLRIGRAGPPALLERLVNPEEPAATYERCASAGGGALVVTGHLGNWELAGACLAALGLPVTAVVRRRETGAERRLAELRERLGIESVPMSAAPGRLRAALAEGRTVALVADQHAAARGIAVPFLGRPASTFLGPARLALALRAPLFFGALLREGSAYRAVLRPIPAPEPGRGAERELTRRWVAVLEEAVRDHPEQYFWFHRRWKLAEGTGGGRNASGSPVVAGSGRTRTGQDDEEP